MIWLVFDNGFGVDKCFDDSLLYLFIVKKIPIDG